MNNLNQLTSIGSAGPSRFAGWINETGLVKVAGLSATMTTFTNFVGSANTTLGTNVVDVVAWDSANNYATNRYQVVITNGIATTLKYDANGNLTNQYTTSYTNYYDWDGEDRLVRITRRSVGDPIEYKSEFLYDGLGRRSQILERTNGVIASNARYLWCGAELCEKRGSGGGTATANYFGLGEFQSPTKYFYTRDHLGSVREMLNASQALQARYDYDPYGRRTTLLGTVPATFGFTGHLYHSGSGLHLAMYRALDSGVGRWLSRDPLSETAGLNLYRYVNNSPLNGIDPDGAFVLSVVFLAVDSWKLGQNIYNGTASFADGAWVAIDLLTLAADVFTAGTGGEGLQASTMSARTLRALEAVSAADKANALAHAGDLALHMATGDQVGSKTGKPCPTSTGKSAPKPSPKFVPPTNPPQLPPANLPPGVRLFRGKPTQQYPNGYWKIEKFDGQGWQRLDPRTMKPGPHPDTHVPFPESYTGPFDN